MSSHADAPEPIERRIVALSSSALPIGTIMSVNDDVSLLEIPDQAEAGVMEPEAVTADVTPAARGYQNLFRAVCLNTTKAPAVSV